MIESEFIRKLVEIDETWEKVDGIVYRLWRIVPRVEWNREITLYKEIPVFFIQIPEIPSSEAGQNEV